MHGDHCLPNPQKRYAMSDETVTESELGIGVLAFYFGATNLITHLQSIEEVPSGVSFP
jgi:hypothetical protein